MMEAAVLSPDDTNRETNEVTEKLDEIKQAIQQQRVAETGVFDMLTGATTGVVQQTHVRMRVRQLVISTDQVGAATFSVRFGQRTYRFGAVGPLTLVLPPPIEIVDRGVDIQATVSAGNLLSAYFTYTPE